MKFAAELILIALCFAACAAVPQKATKTSAEAGNMSAFLENALTAHGGINAIAEKGVTISLEGKFDLSVRLQGRSPDRPELTPISERISIDYSGGRLAYDIDWYNYYSSNQKLREIYDDQRRILFVDLRAGGGGYIPRQSIVDARERYARLLPNLLLAEVLKNTEAIIAQNVTEIDGKAFVKISYQLPDETIIHIGLDSDTTLVRYVSSIIDMPLMGPSSLTWKFDDFKSTEEGLVVPEKIRTLLGEKKMKEVSVSVDLGIDEKSLNPPAGIEVGPPPENLAPLEDFIPYGDRDPVVETIAPGIHLVRSLRPGFALMFVEFPEYVLVVDAPTGWYEMQQLPPKNWSLGDANDALGKKYLRAISETVPGKPLKYLVLTHHHSDHIGGYQPFADAGVTFLAGKAAASMITSPPASGITAPPSEKTIPDIKIIEGSHSIRSGSMEVQLIELPAGNPKADHYLMIYLPKQKILYTTAFIYPVPESVFPPPESVDLSIWFVEWLDSSGLDIDRIYNVHAASLVEDWQLERIRQIAAGRSQK